MDEALRITPDPAWVIRHGGSEPLLEASRQSRFTVSNGYLGLLGVRAVNPPAYDAATPRMYVAGLFDTLGSGQPLSALIPGPDWMRLRLCVRGEPVADAGSGPSQRRTLDMRRAVLLTQGSVSHDSGAHIDVSVSHLVSLADRNVGMQLVRLGTVSGDGEATLEASCDEMKLGLVAEAVDQDSGTWRTTTSGKRLVVAASTALWIDGEANEPYSRGPLRWSWAWRIQPGQVIHLVRTVVVVRGAADDAALGTRARDASQRTGAIGWRGVLARHETAWARRWEDSDVVVDGDPAAQAALRFALFHLNGAANPTDEHVSIAARALTGSGYFGHVFWDTEVFLLPFFTMTWPDAARALLMYRFHTLGEARAKAQRMGFAGALYAWESADTGAECTPGHGVGPDRRIVEILCGTLEQHISADIAYAVWHHWLATGDDAFLCLAGAEILFETARFWASRAHREADGLCHIRSVIGPDEYHERVDDNAYTNVMARWNIERALDVAALLRARWPSEWSRLATDIGLADPELTRWSAVAASIVTGLRPETGLFEQFAGYFALEAIDLTAYRGRTVPMDVVLGRERTRLSQVIKQADVVALLGLLPEAFPGASGAANFGYYEPRCSHGSSLSTAMHGLAAARLGQTARALAFFRDTSAIDLADTQAASDGGVHMAALGGIWMIAVLGFAGVSVREDGLAVDPRMPDGWTRLAFRVCWRGRRVDLAIDAVSSGVEATLLAGDPMALTVGGEHHALAAGIAIRVPYSPSGACSHR